MHDCIAFFPAMKLPGMAATVEHTRPGCVSSLISAVLDFTIGRVRF